MIFLACRWFVCRRVKKVISPLVKFDVSCTCGVAVGIWSGFGSFSRLIVGVLAKIIIKQLAPEFLLVTSPLERDFNKGCVGGTKGRKRCQIFFGALHTHYGPYHYQKALLPSSTKSHTLIIATPGL